MTPGGPTATTLDLNVAAEIKRVLPRTRATPSTSWAAPRQSRSRCRTTSATTSATHVERFGGATRYETALDIAQSPQALNNPQHVVVARGDDFADALASGPFASDKFTDSAGVPAAIVLSPGNGITGPVSVPAETLHVRGGQAGRGARRRPAERRRGGRRRGEGSCRRSRGTSGAAYTPIMVSGPL